jgi:hypothetical protein
VIIRIGSRNFPLAYEWIPFFQWEVWEAWVEWAE